MRSGELLQVLELPMRWYFCSEACSLEWQERRHDADVLEWLKHGAGDRAKVLEDPCDATSQGTAACRRAFTRLCRGTRVALSLSEAERFFSLVQCPPPR